MPVHNYTPFNVSNVPLIGYLHQGRLPDERIPYIPPMDQQAEEYIELMLPMIYFMLKGASDGGFRMVSGGV